MIIYEKGGFDGPSKLFRIHGSAAYKVIVPTIVSTGFLFFYSYYRFSGLVSSSVPLLHKKNHLNANLTVIQHPLVIGAFIAIFSLLLTFRLNFAYSRYWEGATSVYSMMSKWLDCAVLIGAFHYQSSQFDDIRPPTFGSFDVPLTEDMFDSYDRETPRSMLMKQQLELDSSVGSVPAKPQKKMYLPFAKMRLRRRNKKIIPPKQRMKSINISMSESERLSQEKRLSKIPIPMRFQDQLLNPTNDINYLHETENVRNARLYEMKSGQTGVVTNSWTKIARIPAPSLFLQESAHLISLLNAVALSTLRNDIDIAATPIIPYIPGVAWPDVDPDNLPHATKQIYGDGNVCIRWLYFCLGLNRSAKRRTLYNAARPFGVLGGVSDNEINALQSVRGPYAKVTLVLMWLQEFISREYLAGSAGNVPPPFMSRLNAFISDGGVAYNQARKVAYVPFPFVSAQIATFFSLVIIFIFPLLFVSFVTKLWFACVLNFLTVLCFLGLNEVSRELDDPFQNIPNDIPVTTYQAQLNEALVTLYAGFHPDSWWEVNDSDAINFKTPSNGYL